MPNNPAADMTSDSRGLPLFTIGHSTRTVAQFLDLLRAGGVEQLVDVRKVPRSRINPHFNLDTLPATLAEFQIAHCRIESLGGLRKKSATVPPEVNAYWMNASFHNYADYALSDDFRSGLAQLLAISLERRTAIMCAEAVWWRCHRRIVADYAMCVGRREVYHLMDGQRVTPARPTPGLQIAQDGLHYPSHSGD
jgi:uncharacterized protein (DUF488 family)